MSKTIPIGKRHDAAQLAALWIAAGGNPAHAALAAAVALAESGGYPGITASHDGAVGLWQRSPRTSGLDAAALADPATNARQAVTDSRNGEDWRDFPGWTTGIYRQFGPGAGLASHQATARPLADDDRALIARARQLAHTTAVHDLRRMTGVTDPGIPARPYVGHYDEREHAAYERGRDDQAADDRLTTRTYSAAFGMAQAQLDALADVLARVTGEQL